MNPKNMNLPSVSTTESALLLAKCDSTQIVTKILDVLCFQKEADTICEISCLGMKFEVDNGSTLFASAFIQKELFDTYVVHESVVEDPVRFGVRLGVLLECLTLFGPSSAELLFQYPAKGSPLSLILRDSEATTRCELSTLEIIRDPFPVEYLPTLSEPSVMPRVVLDSEFVKDALAESNWSSARGVTIELSPEQPHLRLSSNFTGGSICVEWGEMVCSEVCGMSASDMNPSWTTSCQASFLHAALKGLSSSKRCGLSIDDGQSSEVRKDMLYVVHDVDSGMNILSTVKFAIVPLANEEEEDVYDDD